MAGNPFQVWSDVYNGMRADKKPIITPDVINDWKNGVDISDPVYRSKVLQQQTPDISSTITNMINALINQSKSNTDSANALQLQMMRESNAFSAAQAEKANAFSAEQARIAFERSEQSRLSAQEYSTSERLAAQEYNTAERLAAQEYAQYNADTQYQRAVKDLYAAGLNPLLAVGAQAAAPTVSAGRSSGMSSRGSSASSPSGNAARGNSASAYRTSVESIIGSVLGYMTESDRNEISREKNELDFLSRLISSSLSLIDFF